MAKSTPRSRRAKTPSRIEIGIDDRMTTGRMMRNGMPAPCRRFTTTSPKPIWATVASVNSPIQPSTDVARTTMPMITP